MIAALLLGIATGMRAITGLAAIFIARGGTLAYVFGALALGEYVGDVLPQTPSRLLPLPLAARIVAGAVVGWLVTGAVGANTVIGALVGVLGALVGAYGGAAVRGLLIKQVGPLAAGLLESAVAILIAWVALARLV